MGHALDDFFKLGCVVVRADDRLERVAMRAILNGSFLLRGSRETHEPFGVGELGGKIGSFAQLQIKRCRIVCRKIDGTRSLEIVSRGSDADGVMPRFESRGGELIT